MNIIANRDILIFDQLISQNLSNLVRMPKYGHMFFLLITQLFFVQSG